MKLISYFSEFLRDTVNLNQARLDTLEDSVNAIETFISEADWAPRVWRFEPQGSWANDTIIKPVEGKEFDADLLAIVAPVEGWQAADYVETLADLFRESGRYKDMVEKHDYCVRVVYAGHRRIDVAPCVRGRVVEGQLEVCNRVNDEFRRTEPTLFTEWLTEKNGYSGKNAFRKVTRLVKYLRDITRRFDCSSVVLTTLLGMQINWNDKDTDGFADVPSTLKTVFGRLDDWMQVRPNKPVISNPSLSSEDFAESMSQDAYAKLREVVHDLRARIDEAFAAEGIQASVVAWQKVFGTQFGKGALISVKAELTEEASVVEKMLSTTAWHDDKLVDKIIRYGRWLWAPRFDRPKHMSRPIWPRADIVSERVYVSAVWQQSQHAPTSTAQPVRDFDQLSAGGGLWFDVTVNNHEVLPPGYSVRWRITNTGASAMAIGQGRGGFEWPTEGNKRWEGLMYRGVHLTEAFIIRDSDNRLVGQSAPFHVMIT